MNIYQENFTTYCCDLQKITGTDFFIDQQALSFSELIEVEFEKNPHFIALLKQANCCVIAHDTYERNPQYAHVGTYLINRYGLSCDVVDVIGDGSMPAVRVAEHLLEQYFLHKKIKSAVILLFDDAGVSIMPYNQSDHIRQKELES